MPSKMKLTILASSTVILQVFLGFTSANVWLINRTLTKEPWLNRDSFSIPSSLCQQNNGNDACYPFGALSDKHKNCSCYCPFENSSFVYHENKWTCLQNGKVRNLQDCRETIFFYSEAKNPPRQLWTINIDSKEYLIDIPFSEQAQSGSGWERCEVHLNSSWYLGCDGSRLTSAQYLNKMKELFTLAVESPDRGPGQFALLINGEAQGAQMLKGKIINLGIQCRSSDRHPLQHHGCMMFKLRGQQTCNVSVPNLQKSSTLRPPKPTSLETPTHTSYLLTASVTQLTTLAESTTTLLLQNVRPRPSSGREWSTDNSSSSLGLIAGVIVATVVLVAFIVGFLVYYRRHSNKKPRSRTAFAKGETKQDTVTMNPQTNSAFQCGDENGYKVLNAMAEEPQIYASAYSVPRGSRAKDGSEPGHFSAFLNIQEKLVVHVPRNTQEPFYHILEKPTADSEEALQNAGSNNLKQPVHNHLQEISSAEEPEGPVNYGAKPVYSTLEDPYLEETEGLVHHGTISSAEPIYNTLEEPSSGDLSEVNGNYECANEPVYNVLEEDLYPTMLAAEGHDVSDLQDPVYNVLEGP